MPANPALDEANQLIAAGRSTEAADLLAHAGSDPGCAVRLRELYLGEQRRDKAMAVSRELAAGHGPEAHVSRSVIALLQGDPERALMECTLALEADPKLATAHNHLARALHNADQPLQAVSALRKALELQDNYPEAWANLGLVLRALGGVEEAIRAYRRAVELAPGFITAELNLGISLLLADEVDPALFCLESVLKRDPHNLDALLNAGLALQLRGDLNKAMQYFDHAVRLDENHPLAWLYRGVLLHERHEAGQALDALHRAVTLDPMEIDAWVEIASIHEQAGRLDEASTALEQAGQIDPTHAAMQLELARLKRRQGDLEGALALLKQLASRTLPPRLARQHHFEAGLALDRAGHYEQAFAAYEEGNRLVAHDIRRREIDPRGFDRECRRLEQWLQRGAPGAQPRDADPGGDTGADLCFLVGFRRSGTMRLGTLLATHPEVAVIDERPTLERVVDALRTRKPGYPDVLESLDDAGLEALRRLYRTEAARHLDGRETALLVDKLPLRFMHAGLIHRLFPDARILFSLRHPCDAVLSNFMQPYAATEASIHFDTLQGSVAMYVRTMSLWRGIEERLSLRVHYTRYEHLVADPRAEMAAVCAFLGIEPVPAMFDAAARRTGGWVHYRVQLAPYLAAMQALAEHYRYSLEGA